MVRPSIMAVAAVAIAGCVTTSGGGQPDRTYHSARPTAEVADCLMNRLASGDFRVRKRETSSGETEVAVNGIAGTYFLFTLRSSADGGTDAEMRRGNSIAPGLGNAETCF